MRATPKGEKSCLWIVFPFLLCIEGCRVKGKEKASLYIKLFCIAFF